MSTSASLDTRDYVLKTSFYIPAHSPAPSRNYTKVEEPITWDEALSSIYTALFREKELRISGNEKQISLPYKPELHHQDEELGLHPEHYVNTRVIEISNPSDANWSILKKFIEVPHDRGKLVYRTSRIGERTISIQSRW